MNYHIGRLVLSSLCVGAFGAGGFWWCLFCRLQPAKQNKTTDVVIHQHSRKLLKMDILMSETCWAHNKWNIIARDIKLVFHLSTYISFLAKRSQCSLFSLFCCWLLAVMSVCQWALQLYKFWYSEIIAHVLELWPGFFPVQCFAGVVYEDGYRSCMKSV